MSSSFHPQQRQDADTLHGVLQQMMMKVDVCAGRGISIATPFRNITLLLVFYNWNCHNNNNNNLLFTYYLQQDET